MWFKISIYFKVKKYDEVLQLSCSNIEEAKRGYLIRDGNLVIYGEFAVPILKERNLIDKVYRSILKQQNQSRAAVKTTLKQYDCQTFDNPDAINVADLFKLSPIRGNRIHSDDYSPPSVSPRLSFHAPPLNESLQDKQGEPNELSTLMPRARAERKCKICRLT